MNLKSALIFLSFTLMIWSCNNTKINENKIQGDWYVETFQIITQYTSIINGDTTTYKVEYDYNCWLKRLNVETNNQVKPSDLEIYISFSENGNLFINETLNDVNYQVNGYWQIANTPNSNILLTDTDLLYNILSIKRFNIISINSTSLLIHIFDKSITQSEAYKKTKITDGLITLKRK